MNFMNTELLNHFKRASELEGLEAQLAYVPSLCHDADLQATLEKDAPGAQKTLGLFASNGDILCLPLFLLSAGNFLTDPNTRFWRKSVKAVWRRLSSPPQGFGKNRCLETAKDVMFGSDPSRFKRELDAMSTLRHPNIVEAFDVDPQGRYFSMELFDRVRR